MNKSQKIKPIIFDFDGTIADSFEVFLQSLQVVLKLRRPLTAEEIADLRQSSTREIIKKLGVKKWQLALLVTKGRREIAQRMDSVEVFAGMPEVIKALSATNYTLYIVSTNNRESIDDFLAKYKLSQYITHVYANIGLQGKVKSLKKLQKQQELSAADCLYIGDETRDIEAAKKAHMACIAVGWGFSNPDTLKSYKPSAFVSQPKELLKAIQSLEN